jgi:hypothetical protein
LEEELLAELKGRLSITWNDEDTNLKKIIKGATGYLSYLTNAFFDFAKEDWPKELLLERARYVYNNASDEFESNFKEELSRLILLAAVGKVGTLNEIISTDV